MMQNFLSTILRANELSNKQIIIARDMPGNFRNNPAPHSHDLIVRPSLGRAIWHPQ
jgi:hypothetical protein